MKVVALPLIALAILSTSTRADELTLKQECNINKGMIAQQAAYVRKVNAIMGENDDKAELDVWVAGWSQGHHGDFVEMLNDWGPICATAGVNIIPAGWEGVVASNG